MKKFNCQSKILIGWGIWLVTACNSSDIGKACNEDKDCAEELICDVHDGQGTCQKPHEHNESESDSDSEHEHESESESEDGHHHS